MSENRYKLQTWTRRNSVALARLGDAQNDLASEFARAAADATAREPQLGIADLVELPPDSVLPLLDRCRALLNIAGDLHNLRPVPDDAAQALLTEALNGYQQVGELFTSEEPDGAAAIHAWEAAGDAYERFSQRLADAAQ